MMVQNLKACASFAAVLVILLGAAKGVSAASVELSESYFYSGTISGNWSQKLDKRFYLFEVSSEHPDGPHKLRISYDAVYEVTDCPRISERLEYICILSDYYSFTYPRYRTRDMKSWAFNSKFGVLRYSVLEEDVYADLGGRQFQGLVRVETFETAPGSAEPVRRFETLYSPRYGIVGIVRKDEDLSEETLWLSDREYGLGALR